MVFKTCSPSPRGALAASVFAMLAGDAEARASLCDLLRVTRAVWRPVEENGTHWCAGTSPEDMLRWTLSELAEVEEEVAGLRRIPASDAAASEAALARVQDELGDLIFDVLMLACACERRLGGGPSPEGPAARSSSRPNAVASVTLLGARARRRGAARCGGDARTSSGAIRGPSRTETRRRRRGAARRRRRMPRGRRGSRPRPTRRRPGRPIRSSSGSASSPSRSACSGAGSRWARVSAEAEEERRGGGSGEEG